jgi:hypothetical protein
MSLNAAKEVMRSILLLDSLFVLITRTILSSKHSHHATFTGLPGNQLLRENRYNLRQSRSSHAKELEKAIALKEANFSKSKKPDFNHLMFPSSNMKIKSVKKNLGRFFRLEFYLLKNSSSSPFFTAKISQNLLNFIVNSIKDLIFVI